MFLIPIGPLAFDAAIMDLFTFAAALHIMGRFLAVGTRWNERLKEIKQQ